MITLKKSRLHSTTSRQAWKLKKNLTAWETCASTIKVWYVNAKKWMIQWTIVRCSSVLRKRIVIYFSSYVVLEELPNVSPHANIWMISVLTVFLGDSYLKNQLPLSVAAVTKDAKACAEQGDIPVPRETETKKLKAGGSSVKKVNPFSKVALRGMDIVKQCTGKVCAGKLFHKRGVAMAKELKPQVLIEVWHCPYQLVHLVVV